MNFRVDFQHRRNEKELFILAPGVLAYQDTKLFERFLEISSDNNKELVKSVANILIDMYESKPYSQSDIQKLANTSIEEFIKLFKSTKGEDLHKIIKASLSFKDSEKHKQIYESAISALIKIGEESELNSMRIGSYGIHILN